MGELSKAFKALHVSGKPFIIPNPWDKGSARILAAHEYQALATTSAGLAYALGRPEGQITLEEKLNHCREMVEATSLPVSADLEKGFADAPDAVAKNVLKAVETGLAGASIEDYTGDPAMPAFEFDLAVERVRASVTVAKDVDPNFVFTARCDVLQYEAWPLADVIERLKAFAAVGADCVYAPGLYDLESIRQVCRSVDCPVNVVMGMPGPTFTLKDLASAGVARVSVGSVLARRAYSALVEAALEMRDEGSFLYADQALGFQEFDKMMVGD